MCMLLLLLSRFSRVRLCATPEMAAHQAPPSLGFSKQEHWSGLPFVYMHTNICVCFYLYLCLYSFFPLVILNFFMEHTRCFHPLASTFSRHPLSKTACWISTHPFRLKWCPLCEVFPSLSKVIDLFLCVSIDPC